MSDSWFLNFMIKCQDWYVSRVGKFDKTHDERWVKLIFGLEVTVMLRHGWTLTRATIENYKIFLWNGKVSNFFIFQ